MNPADLLKDLNGDTSEYALAQRHHALLLSVLIQANEDYQGLKKRGVFLGGEINEGFFDRYASGSAGYRRPMNFQRQSEITELLHFFEDWPLDLLCHHTGVKACRIRRKLGFQQRRGQ